MPNLPSKREVLSKSLKIYDPHGLLSPVTIRAKLLMQEVCQQSIEWDEPLPQKLSEKQLSIAEDIDNVIRSTVRDASPLLISTA